MLMLVDINSEGLLILLFFAGLAAMWIYALVDCWIRNDLTIGQKIAWTLVILFGHLLGLIIYFIFASSRRRRSSGFYPKPLNPVTGAPTNFNK